MAPTPVLHSHIDKRLLHRPIHIPDSNTGQSALSSTCAPLMPASRLPSTTANGRSAASGGDCGDDDDDDGGNIDFSERKRSTEIVAETSPSRDSAAPKTG